MSTVRTGASPGKTRLHLLLAGALLTCCAHARAGESMFGYTYTTETEPRGELEMGQWITDREGQAHGEYHNLQGRTELEYGLTDNWSISGYLNYSYISASNNSVFHDTRGLDIPAVHNPSLPYSALRFDSVSVESVYRLFSPKQAPIGLALYMEPEIGPRERALELRLIIQKNFLDNRLILAANVMGEPNWEDEGSGETESATALEFALGLSYRTAPNWRIALEFLNHNQFRGIGINQSRHEYSALFLGPTVHYESQRWWATLTILPQIYAAGYTPEQRNNMVGNRIYGNAQTAIDGIRVKFGVEF